jgi:hypothetical protein
MGLLDWLKNRKTATEITPQEGFTREVEHLLRAKPHITVRRGTDDFVFLVTANGRESTVFLGNLFQETRDLGPAHRAGMINRFVTGIANPLPQYDTLETAREVMAVTLRGSMGLLGANIVSREFLPCLREYLVLDGEHNIAYCSEQNANQWGAPLDALFEIGRRRIADAGVKLSVEHEQQIFSIDNDDDYESARLVLPGFLAGFRDRVQGRPIAIVPARNQLSVAGDADPQTVITMCERAERQYAASSRRVSGAVYSVDDEGRVIRYVRDVRDEAALRVKASHVRFEGTEYAAQRSELEAAFEKERTDIFVASLGGIETERGELISWTSVASHVHALIPRADVIALENTVHPRALYAFDDVLRVAPHRLRAHPTFFPTRWETHGDFTDDEVRQLTPVTL